MVKSLELIWVSEANVKMKRLIISFGFLRDGKIIGIDLGM
jgi:hypothetical protein